MVFSSFKTCCQVWWRSHEVPDPVLGVCVTWTNWYQCWRTFQPIWWEKQINCSPLCHVYSAPFSHRESAVGQIPSGQQQTKNTKHLLSWNLHSHGENDNKELNKWVNIINAENCKWHRPKKKKDTRWLGQRRVSEGVDSRWGVTIFQLLGSLKHNTCLA